MHTATKTLIAAALVAALAVPATASAIPGMGRLGRGRTNPNGNAAKGSISATATARQEKRLEELKERITAILARRKARFDAAADRLTARTAKVSGFADKVEQAGGDVSAVRTGLAEVTTLIAKAKSEEAAAVELFKAVPDAADRKAAFAAARAQAKVARQTLQSARKTLRDAVLTLRSVARGLEGADQ